MSGPEARRLFFALWPDGAGAEALAAAARAAHKTCGGRPMGRDDLHLTLAFLGDATAERLAAAEEAAAGVAAAPFDFAIDRLGCWQHNRIFWAGCTETPPPLAALAQALGERLRAAGFVLEVRPFAPHVTLLRQVDCSRASPPLATAVPWPAAEFVLAESRRTPAGGRYAVIGRWPLVPAIG